jgi:DNA-binding CsgD family transcriptional regulator
MSDGLSKREQVVLSWLQQGLSNKEIAQALGISPRTVQKHLQRIYHHLGVQTRAEAIVLAHKQKPAAGEMRSEKH